MLGADVGTALMTVVFSFDLSWLVAAADLRRRRALHLAPEQRASARFGRILIGLGLIMLALQLIVAATRPLTESPAVHGAASLADRRRAARHARRRAPHGAVATRASPIVLLIATLAALGT